MIFFFLFFVNKIFVIGKPLTKITKNFLLEIFQLYGIQQEAGSPKRQFHREARRDNQQGGRNDGGRGRGGDTLQCNEASITNTFMQILLY